MQKKKILNIYYITNDHGQKFRTVIIQCVIGDGHLLYKTFRNCLMMMISEHARVFLKSFPCNVKSGLPAWITGMSPAEMNHYHMAGVLGDSVVLPNSLLLHKRELVVIQRDTKRSAYTAHIGHSCEVLKLIISLY